MMRKNRISCSQSCQKEKEDWEYSKDKTESGPGIRKKEERTEHSPHQLPPETILRGRYRIGPVLGEGGYGITYIGYDCLLQIRVAIKEYFPTEWCTRDAGGSLSVTVRSGISSVYFSKGVQNSLTEARLLARMDSQRVIVGVRDYFEENGTAYIVMEYIDGKTFTDLTGEYGGRIPEKQLFQYVCPLIRALSAMHEEGMIHRDLCPDNLMLENGRRIRLLDFGNARFCEAANDTQTITIRHGYAPIEQYQQGGGQGPWTDVYALCATLYFCLTGTVPPIATNRIIEDTLVAPSQLGADLSAHRERVLLKGLRVHPHRRYPTMRELWKAFYEQECEKKG